MLSCPQSGILDVTGQQDTQMYYICYLLGVPPKTPVWDLQCTLTTLLSVVRVSFLHIYNTFECIICTRYAPI